MTKIGGEMIEHDRAREYAAAEREKIVDQVDGMHIDQLKAEYIAAMEMVAYYTKLEQITSATPRYQFDSLRAALVDIGADEILNQATQASEEGFPLAQYCRVKAKPLLNILSRVKLIVTDHQ